MSENYLGKIAFLFKLKLFLKFYLFIYFYIFKSDHQIRFAMIFIFLFPIKKNFKNRIFKSNKVRPGSSPNTQSSKKKIKID